MEKKFVYTIRKIGETDIKYVDAVNRTTAIREYEKTIGDVTTSFISADHQISIHEDTAGNEFIVELITGSSESQALTPTDVEKADEKKMFVVVVAGGGVVCLASSDLDAVARACKNANVKFVTDPTDDTFYEFDTEGNGKFVEILVGEVKLPGFDIVLVPTKE